LARVSVAVATSGPAAHTVHAQRLKTHDSGLPALVLLYALTAAANAEDPKTEGQWRSVASAAFSSGPVQAGASARSSRLAGDHA